MLIPEAILEKQICVQCKHYLSVGPVKVYRNREIRCGRCATGDDPGVVSNLYNAVIKSMKFPCKNRFDGCNETHFINDMNLHETSCPASEYECNFCILDFRGNAFNLFRHCQTFHTGDTIQNAEFPIDFEKGNHDKMYFYSVGAQMFFVRYDCHIDSQNLTFDLTFVGKNFKGDIFYSFRMYSIDNQLLYKSKRHMCSTMENSCGALSVDLKKTNCILPKIVICRFFVQDEPELTFEENVPVIDDSFSTFTLRCLFNNVHEIHDDDKELFYPALYYFKGITWRVFIKRKFSLTDYKRKFGVYIEWLRKEGNNVPDSCKITTTFSVFTHDLKRKITKSLGKKRIALGQRQGIMLHDWNSITDRNGDFLRDNQIQVEIKMNIDFAVTKPVTCRDCSRHCIYCNDVGDHF